MTTGNIFDVRRYSVHDGPGIRTAVFFKGCPARCIWCHNPESQEYGREVMFWPSRCNGCGMCVLQCSSGALRMEDGRPKLAPELCARCGECVEVCPRGARTIVGRELSIAEVMDQIELDRAFYDESSGGVTFTGGEPLAQPEFLCALAQACRDVEIHTAVDTSGIVGFQAIQLIAPVIDLWLYDIKAVNDASHVIATGCSNRLPIANLRWLVKEGCDVELRVPLIPGFNDDDKSISSLIGLIDSLEWSGPAKVSLLPYHRLGNEKYARLGRECRMKDAEEPGSEDVDRVRNAFIAMGVDVQIGG